MITATKITGNEVASGSHTMTMYVPTSKALTSKETPSTSKGECISILTDEKECFSVSVSEADCFFIKSDEESDGDEEIPTPPILSIPDVRKIKDIIRQGDTLIILCWVGSANTPSIIMTELYTSLIHGNLIGISDIQDIKALSEFGIDIEEASLANFSTTSRTDYIAIITTTKTVYVNPVFFSEIETIYDENARKYPFSYSHDMFWTNSIHWSGETATATTPVGSYSVYRTSNGNNCHSPTCYPNNDRFDEVYAEGLYRVTRAGVIEGKAGSDIGQKILGHPDNWWGEVSYTFNGGGGSVSDDTEVGHSLISKGIRDEDEILTSGLNYFTGNLDSISSPTPTISKYDMWVTESNLTIGQKGEVSTYFPTEVDLGKPFHNVRPNIAFCEGYIATGEEESTSVATPMIYAWSTGYIRYRMEEWVDWWTQANKQIRSLTGHIVSTSANTNGVRFVLAPFSQDTRKVQNGDKWISMGNVAINVGMSDIVDDLPEVYGIPCAIVGNDVLEPILEPTKNSLGRYETIKIEYSLEENKTPTRDVEFVDNS